MLPRDRPWNQYPVGTKAHADNGGFWIRVSSGWKWGQGSIFPTPGGAAVGNCVELPSQTIKVEPMPFSTESIKGTVVANAAEARAHGKGAIWYHWIHGSRGTFPQDVAAVMIQMPVNWGDGAGCEHGIAVQWPVSQPALNGKQWVLSGTLEKPTLSPDIIWEGAWHGSLTDGFLKSH